MSEDVDQQATIDVEILEYLGPLVLYGEGVVLRVRYQSTIVVGLYFSDTSAEPAVLAAHFPPGGRLRVYVELEPVTPDADTPCFPADLPPVGIYPTFPDPRYQAHNVRVVGLIRAYQPVPGGDHQLLVDAHIPLITQWNRAEPIRVGEPALWCGDLRLWDATKQV